MIRPSNETSPARTALLVTLVFLGGCRTYTHTFCFSSFSSSSSSSLSRWSSFDLFSFLTCLFIRIRLTREEDLRARTSFLPAELFYCKELSTCTYPADIVLFLVNANFQHLCDSEEIGNNRARGTSPAPARTFDLRKHSTPMCDTSPCADHRNSTRIFSDVFVV